ncbi:MAG: OmpA family protein [Desulfosarcina sp.]|nr:OmpA family protein [Desulfobacterales bacterium]
MKTKFFLASLLILLIGFANNATAENKAGALTVSPMIGGYLFEGNQDLDNEATYGLGLGYNIDQNWGLEGMFNFIDTDSKKDAGDVDAYIYRIDTLYHFTPDKKLIPYVATGIGGITFDPDRESNNTSFLVNYGGGLKYFVNDFTALRADVRHIISFNDEYNNLAYTFGLTFLIGGEKKALSAEYKDSDGDGVYDHMDQCPNTPQGVAVDDSGCPLDSDGDGVFDHMDQCPNTPQGVAVDDSGCPLDSDGDGVFDYMDQCPNTPQGVAVDDSGCPLDSDGDGVFDYLDKCPDTPKGATVNESGCWAHSGEVFFDFDKSELKSAGCPLLKEAVNILEKNPEMRIEIQGHTDSDGTEAYNQTLSEKRAMAVKAYLVKQGINSDRLETKGYGLSNPTASNDTKEGRQKNRRVTFAPIQ